jgi:hypothetical protein
VLRVVNAINVCKSNGNTRKSTSNESSITVSDEPLPKRRRLNTMEPEGNIT